MATFQDHFSGVATGYRAFRPRYPPALFDWLAAAAPSRAAALDLGCGNGQATVALAERFERVWGVDPSAQQVANAEPHARVTYRVAPAEATGLPDASVDVALAAQAFHWFDHARLFPELRRVARPGAVFAACTYALMRVAPEIDAVVDHLYGGIVGPDWPPERVHTENGYRDLPFPLEPVAAPALTMEESWTLPQLQGYLGTWSAVSRHRARTGADPLAQVEPALRAAWGEPDAARTVRWPLAVRAGRLG
jgi:SAM-dependent methyltransferase